ncbi:MAG: PilZ domain-containing protein [Candidatus Velthaea sp.]
MSNDDPLRGVQLRKHPRLSVSFPLTFLVDGDSRMREGRSVDIGAGGMHFESSDRVAPRSALTICFGLRPGLSLQLRAHVISVASQPAKRMHHYRVVFDEVPDHVREAIMSHVNDAWRAALMSKM